ncbi:MAG: hypothetical protein HQ472_01485 [Ignavibacteria bacterium]|nr:hypothetical protein [Ignavibacteria bacterium]
MRTSPYGVVLALAYQGSLYHTKVVLIQGSSVIEKIFQNSRFSQGVFSDDTTLYLARFSRGTAAGILASCNNNFENWKEYREDKAIASGRLSTQITSVNGTVTIVDLLKGCVVKRPHDSTYSDVWGGYYLYPGPAEAFTILDTTYFVDEGGVRGFPVDSLTSANWRRYGARFNAWGNITVTEDSVMWIAINGSLIVHSSKTAEYSAVRVFLTDNIYHASAGKYGALVESSSPPKDTVVFRYMSYDNKLIHRLSMMVPNLFPKNFPGGYSMGWSQGYFYIAIVEDTNKVGVYRIKEPEPPVSVDEEPTLVSAEVEAPQKLSMTQEEFVEWRKQRAAHTTYTDVNGKRLDVGGVVRSGVVMVREGAKVFVVLVE